MFYKLGARARVAIALLGQLEYDFVVAPGAEPQKIRFQVVAAKRVKIDHKGNLLLHTLGGALRQHR